ncbi:MAG: GGDEF domain-containing protein [Comamonadaceae bacterium]|nr:GGDEF domain-containing protein [Comamonadaceae bacterium]MBK9028343.1 GGDEF domain-containing protein [Propionivibrio sp.]
MNHRHGHPVGDAALVHFAATLRRHLRPADTIARLGGDEFALILMNCSGGHACLLLERLQQGLAGSPLSVPGGAVPLRFSAGAELHAAESLGQVLERADAALLDAKLLGKAMVRLSVPPARSARAAAASACDRRTASACVPIAIDERESDG